MVSTSLRERFCTTKPALHLSLIRPISGPIITKLGWRFCFRFFSIAVGILFLLQVFCSELWICFCCQYLLTLCQVPETTYHRESVTIADFERRGATDIRVTEKNGEKIEHIESKTQRPPSSITSGQPKRKSYVEELAIFNGIYPSSASVLQLLIRPFAACLTPVCLWASLLYGVAITWLVLIATAVAQIFSAPREFSSAFIFNL